MKTASAVPARQLSSDGLARQAFLLLRTVFTVAPIIFGLDKFTNILADWTVYLAPPGHGDRSGIRPGLYVRCGSR